MTRGRCPTPQLVTEGRLKGPGLSLLCNIATLKAAPVRGPLRDVCVVSLDLVWILWGGKSSLALALALLLSCAFLCNEFVLYGVNCGAERGDFGGYPLR